MRYDGYKLNTENPAEQDAAKERNTYCVSEPDTWGFDGYLLAVLTNGMQSLADNAHGWPQSEELPEFEDWVKLLQQAADDAYWCLVAFEQEEYRIHEELYPKSFGDYEDITAYLTAKLPEEAYAKWRVESKKLADEREMRKDRLMDFVKKYFWALWD